LGTVCQERPAARPSVRPPARPPARVGRKKNALPRSFEGFVEEDDDALRALVSTLADIRRHLVAI
jgi:hypothetical protein